MDEHCSCRVIGPGTYPPGDPDGSKSRAKFEQDGGCGQFAKDKEQKKPQDTGCYCGLDLSLTSSGWATLRGGKIEVGTIKTTPKTCENDLARLRYICDKIMAKIPDDVKMVAAEDFYAPRGPSAGSAISLAMLAAVIRTAMYEKGIKFIIIAPVQNKLYCTGSGKSEKNLMLLSCFKRWNLTLANDDEGDAVALCYLAHAIDIYPECDPDETKPMREVVKRIIKERPKYNFKKEA